MVYLIHSNSYDMNCFSFLSSNKESRTDVRLSLSCCQKSRIVSAFGKEDSYERNPSGVSFVFNHRIFRTFMKVLKMPFSMSKRIFDMLGRTDVRLSLFYAYFFSSSTIW